MFQRRSFIGDLAVALGDFRSSRRVLCEFVRKSLRRQLCSKVALLWHVWHWYQAAPSRQVTFCVLRLQRESEASHQWELAVLIVAKKPVEWLCCGWLRYAKLHEIASRVGETVGVTNCCGINILVKSTAVKWQWNLRVFDAVLISRLMYGLDSVLGMLLTN